MNEQPTGSTASSNFRPRIGLLLAVQLVLVSAAAAGVFIRSRQIDRRAALPVLREVPLEVGPLYDEPLMVADDQLVAALRKLRPRPQGKETKIGTIDHHLRFWGPEAKFHDPDLIDGEDLRRVLTDHEWFKALYREQGDKSPLLIDVPGTGGVRVRDLEGAMSSPHNDHTAAGLAEVGTPLNYPVKTPKVATTYRAMVEQAYRDFSLNQPEYEWSALLFALFTKQNRWVTSEGQEVDFDMLAARIMRQQMPQGVCMGNHRLHALVMLLRVNEIWDGPRPLLSSAMEEKIVKYLEDTTATLIAHQHPEGFWNIDWPTKAPASSKPTSQTGDDLGSRIIATGHTLEWWSLVPKKYEDRLIPPRDVRVAAAQWLVRTINELSDDQIEKNSSYLSHAGRALALWRGKLPHQINLAPHDQKN